MSVTFSAAKFINGSDIAPLVGVVDANFNNGNASRVLGRLNFSADEPWGECELQAFANALQELVATTDESDFDAGRLAQLAEVTWCGRLAGATHIVWA